MADTFIKVNLGDRFRVDHDVAAASEGLYVEGTKVVGTQGANIADLAVTSGSTTVGDVETALNLAEAKINAILTALEAHGLLASS